jgi:hypothetical protein
VNPRSFGVVLSVALVLPQCGCSGQYKTVPVEGIVTLDGKPVEGATVSFCPAEGRPASGLTDADGVFQLTTFKEDDGALPGDYRVVVKKTEGHTPLNDTKPGEDKDAAEHYRRMVDTKKPKKTLLPAVYGDEATTMLRCRVPAEGRVTVELKSTP